MTIDANIIIAYLGGDSAVIKALTEWRQKGIVLFLSSVVEAEVLSFTKWTLEERLETEKFLEANFTSVSFDRTLAKIAAKIRRNVKIKFPDAAIAATAIFTNTPVVTRNQQDFKKILAIQLVKI